MPYPKLAHQGCWDKDAQDELMRQTPFLGDKPTSLTGSSDALTAHQAGNYVVLTAGVDAMTLAAPVAGAQYLGGDDGLIMAVYSDTTNAHTITATSLFANGTALKTTATFAAFRGAGVTLRAYNGVYQVMCSTGVTFS